MTSRPRPPPTPVDTTEPRPLRVLLINDGAHHLQLIQQELVRQNCEVVGVIDQAALIHDCVLRLQPDVVIVDSESPSRDTLENLATLNERMPRPVVMFAEDDSPACLRQAMKSGVSAYVVAGLQAERLNSVMQVAIVRFEQDLALRQELDRTRAQLIARKSIERAKGILMNEMGMAEDAAHHHMRRLAMDRGLPLAEVAERIIDAHSLLRSG
ncbi:ANTAR domain-containing response regulator [Roseateles koreensis]|uniref:ANTAR domain-containing protein n=1 Tax=Roseateles koreensis TaxID=2987526 RepID=A0ABT5KUM5_9BURK|nr:ANTAR domain-containing protein [Roseateles koreensis]MDC8786643.1 ANTAR domain-containing protein [Roseateles koreensis]